MKGTQLIPSSTEEDSRSVSVEPVGTGIAPTMQVSLAKRIVQAGTNRVVCLAAQTTVPMEDDDIASVSDLALRLSDGTNVRVSMSFFNDVACEAGFVGATTRRVYDPDWYDNHRAPQSSSRLWLVVAALCVVTAGSFCYFIPGGIEKLAAEIVKAMPPVTVSVFPKPQALKPASPVAGNSTTSNVSQVDRKAKRTYNSKTAKAQSSKSPRKSWKGQNSAVKVGHSSSSGSKSILIPPPPPSAYAIPISQMAMYNMPPYAMPTSPTVTPVKPVSSVTKSKLPSLDIPKQDMPSVLVLSTPNKAQSASKSMLSPHTQSLFPEPARAYSHPRRTSERFDNSAATASGASAMSAPLPGGSKYSEQLQLERIELP